MEKRAREFDAPNWLTQPEAASRLGVSLRTVRRWIEWEWLPARRFGHLVRIDVADVDRLLAEGTPNTRRAC